jgi:hypothetical protein
MAKHYRKRHHHRHHRHNPFGISQGVITDALWTTTGALGSLWLGGTLSSAMPTLGSGWGGVLGTGLSAAGVSYVGKMIGGAKASEELMKGGLVAVIIKALHQMGVAQNMGLGLYSPSWFGIPTSSDQYLRAAAPGMAFNRGAGSIWFPGPGGVPQLALPAGHPAALKGLGFHRFRSRYAGNY